ncbi:helix-turn-helix domain-containing protein [Fastidiosibacter lacustris]|uniref:helix-turn-helix domain-containing protein n=1 Tax=Fastidiosibacter lacustris TaxID=2056695 RepID=UPI000E355443|nr:helix-turn-helix transcriptional regulator [Fastidiosibacter lacustris]
MYELVKVNLSVNMKIETLKVNAIDGYKKLNIIGTNLKIYMYQKNVNSVELSKELGLSTGTVSKIVNGKCNPTILTLLAITNYLGITIENLLTEQHTRVEKSYDMLFPNIGLKLSQ